MPYCDGLPIMRSPDDSDDAEELNDIYREKSFINGAKFIDTWSGFTDKSGRYSAVGPDMSGQIAGFATMTACISPRVVI